MILLFWSQCVYWSSYFYCQIDWNRYPILFMKIFWRVWISLGTGIKTMVLLNNDTIKQGKIFPNFQALYKQHFYVSTVSVCRYWIIVDERPLLLLSDNFVKFRCHKLEIDTFLIIIMLLIYTYVDIIWQDRWCCYTKH